MVFRLVDLSKSVNEAVATKVPSGSELLAPLMESASEPSLYLVKNGLW